MVREKVQVGLIGAGRIGRLHAEHLAFRLPQAHLVAVADVNRAAAETCAAAYRIPTVYDDYRFLLSAPDIDAVVICSSTDTHARIIEEAAQVGKHIFCEKPIDFDLQRIDQALAAVEKNGVKLQIGFNRRFDPHFHALREAIAAGKIGTPHLLRITSRDPAPPPLAYIQVSGGLFLDMTIHDFDMARYLIGSEVTSVYAVGGVRIDPQIGSVGDIDTAVITLEFANGVIGTIDNSRQAVYGYDQRVEVLGSDGVLRAENPASHCTVWGNATGMHTPPLLHFFLERYQDSYLREMEAFLTAILQDTP
ncbi:MAG: inositol 2-dehydrogenase, partial [Nitrospinota bacterium]